MKRWILLALLVLGASAMAMKNPSVALKAGIAGGGAFGVEPSWDCKFFQPEVGKVRVTPFVGFTGDAFSASLSMRYMYGGFMDDLQVGGGVGMGYATNGKDVNGFYLMVRGDVEYDLALRDLPNPLFVGADFGYAAGFGKGFEGFFLMLKLGMRF